MKVASSQPTRLRLVVVLDGMGLKFRGEMWVGRARLPRRMREHWPERKQLEYGGNIGSNKEGYRWELLWFLLERVGQKGDYLGRREKMERGLREKVWRPKDCSSNPLQKDVVFKWKLDALVCNIQIYDVFIPITTGNLGISGTTTTGWVSDVEAWRQPYHLNDWTSSLRPKKPNSKR